MRNPKWFVVAVLLGVLGCGGESKESPPSAPQTTQIERLDPDPYRQTIEQLEDILYQSSPAGYGRADHAGAVFSNLARFIEQRDLGIVAREAAKEIRLLAANVGAESDVGYANPDMTLLRARWEGLRRNFFEDRFWYLKTTSAVEMAQVPETPKIDPTFLAKFTGILGELDVLMLVGRNETAAMGDLTGVREGSSEAVRKVQKWNEWTRGWNDRLTHIATRLPPAPPWEANPHFVQAHEETASAINALRNVPMSVGSWAMPFQSAVKTRFDTASSHLQNARNHMSQAKP